MALEFLSEIVSRLEELLDDDVKERIDHIAKHHARPLGVDQFGFDPSTLKAIAPFSVWLYRNYFRVETVGAENIPSGRMMVIANHSGQLPFDGAMIITAFMLEPKIPRLLRGMVERFSSELPFIGTLM